METIRFDANVSSRDILEVAPEAMPNTMLRRILNDLAYEKSVVDEAGMRGPCNHLETVFSRRSAVRHRNPI